MPCLDDARWSQCSTLEFLAMCYFGYGVLFLLPLPFFTHPFIRGREGYPARIVVPAILTTFLLVGCILTTVLLSRFSNPDSGVSATFVDILILIGMLSYALWSLQLGFWLLSAAKPKVQGMEV